MSTRNLDRRTFLATSALTAGGMALSAQEKPAKPIPAKAEPFPLRQVRLLPSVWADMMELNRSFLYSLPNDRLVHNFRVTAGLPSSAKPLGGWEAPDCELRGHYIGHYLSACALLYGSTGDGFIREKANALVAMLVECQTKNGYLGAYPKSFYDRLSKHEKVWAPFYTLHKIMAGMIDMYLQANNKQALEVATRMAAWADRWSASFSTDEWQKVLMVEHGGMNEAAFNLYAITGNTQYRDLAYRFEHKQFFDPLAAGEDKLDHVHANTNIPKVIGAVRGYQLTGDERYLKIAQNFYGLITGQHTYCTGGTSNGELWQKPNTVASQLGRDAQECCCSYNMMKLSRLLFTTEPDAKYFDYYERLLYNVRRGTQDRNGMLMYYVPLQPGLYKTFGTPFDAFWCCTGTGSEEYVKLSDSIYFHDQSSLYVNLFIPSKLDWTERGLRLSQTTSLPVDGRIAFKIESAPAEPVPIYIRIPYWVTGVGHVTINGVKQPHLTYPSTYLSLGRRWQAGDSLTVDLPITPHISPAPDDHQIQAAMYGPIVLAALMGAEGLTNSMIYAGPGPDESDRGMPIPEVTEPGIWFERTERTNTYSLRFQTKGRGPIHTLAPLSEIQDERYSVYLRNRSV